LVTAFVLVLTILLAVAVGVGAGFLIISSILNAFARRPQQAETAPAMIAHSVTGD
jgi:hypothetical protein